MSISNSTEIVLRLPGSIDVPIHIDPASHLPPDESLLPRPVSLLPPLHSLVPHPTSLPAPSGISAIASLIPLPLSLMNTQSSVLTPSDVSELPPPSINTCKASDEEQIPCDQVHAFTAAIDALFHKHWRKLQKEFEQLCQHHLMYGLPQAGRDEQQAQPAYDTGTKAHDTRTKQQLHGSVRTPSKSRMSACAHKDLAASPERQHKVSGMPMDHVPMTSRHSHGTCTKQLPSGSSSTQSKLRVSACADKDLAASPQRQHTDSDMPIGDLSGTSILRGVGRKTLSSPSFLFEQETEIRHVSALKHAFIQVDMMKEEELILKSSSFLVRIGAFDRDHVERCVETTVGLLIFANAILIGIEMDTNPSGQMGVWNVVDALFCCVYLSELGMKLFLHGFCGLFCGPYRLSNIFDACLVQIDLIQMIIGFLPSKAPEKITAGFPKAALFRLLRLVKVIRTLRLLRSAVFKDLLTMMHGMAGGMRTLAWSLVLFAGVVYVASLVFRESFGTRHDPIEHVHEMFNSVPKSMYTTFRCSFGDCSSKSGVPIFEHVWENYPWIYSAIYCLFLFGITIGLFNVISAIFLEATMAAASRLADEKKQARLNDDGLWSTNIVTLITQLFEIWGSPDFTVQALRSKSNEEVQAISIPWTVIQTWSEDEQVLKALNDLDIDPHDSHQLHDILDPDNNGEITVTELVDGLRRLRGFTRRSDILIVDLMVRALQRDVGDLLRMFDESASATNENGQTTS